VKIFLVEDAPLLRERVATLLRGIAGANIVGSAATAGEALSAILSIRPDAVILDLHLADGSSGFDVLRALHKQAPAIKVFVLTNFPSEAYRRVAERFGARGFFDKSSEFDRLRDMLAAA
jgi:DNA-binding NarL/FixJ family response regulator